MTPSSFESFVMNAKFDRSLLFEGIESNVTKDGQVMSTIVFSYLAVIFTKCDIQNPVERVFNLPVGTFCSE